MDALIEDFKKLQTTWNEVYSTLHENPAVVTPHLQGINIEQINEVILTIEKVLSEIRPPRGFQASFSIAKSLAITATPSALTCVQNIKAAQYNFFPSFIQSLNQILSAFHSMQAFSAKRDAIARLATDLAEKLALLDTAQTELKKKSDVIGSATKHAEEVTEYLEEIKNQNEESQNLIAGIKTHLGTANNYIETIKLHTQKFTDLEVQLSDSIKAAETLQGDLQNQKNTIDRISEENKKQQTTINSLLPRAASAGLASAFSARIVDMEKSKKLWGIIFFLSIAGLLATGWYVFYTQLQIQTGSEFWKVFFQKIPIWAPLIWSGWFSAIQYGNSLRVQEDYAFKEATSKAFQGYRDHMEHLETVDVPSAGKALNLLSVKTIEILSSEPLRVFGKNEKDASPAQALAENIKEN